MESVLVKVSSQWKKILVQPYERFSGHLPEELWEDAYQWVYVHWQEEKKQVGGSQVGGSYLGSASLDVS